MTETVPVTGVAQTGRDRVRVMTGLTTHAGRPYLCGPALTCACAPEDNLAMHAALYQAGPGAVLVCDGAGSTRCALFGELMATDALGQGLAGLVVAGPVRDIADIDELGFPVWCTGTASLTSAPPRLVRGKPQCAARGAPGGRPRPLKS